MKKFYMLIGLPGCDKLNFIKEQQDSGTIYISSEDIRESEFGDFKDRKHNNEVYNSMMNKSKQALSQHYNVMYDDYKNIKRKRRIGLLKELPECEKIAVVFATPMYECHINNVASSRMVPAIDIINSYSGFQMPHYAEGFDRIEIITDNSIDAYKSLIKEEQAILNTSHDNSHHSLSIGEHCHKAAVVSYDIAKRENLDYDTFRILNTACRFHDIGKRYCKTFEDKNGEITDTAHYYGHDSVSAYLTLCGLSVLPEYSVEDVVTITNLINNHMVFFEDSTANKRHKLYGDDFWKLLEYLHEADVSAH